MEIGAWVLKCSALQDEKAFEVPHFEVGFISVNVDREIEEVGDHGGRRVSCMKDVETLEDENIGVPDYLRLIGHDVVGVVRIHRCRNIMFASFEGSQKPHHAAQIIALRKSLASHQPPFLQDPSGVQEPIGGDKLYLWMIRPSGEDGAQH